jgi:hypothetical protein
MKELLIIVSLFCKLAWPQTETGTVVVFVLAKNEITVAADSLSTYDTAKKPTNDSCKIRAFGNKFFFAMAGPVAHKKDAGGPAWSAYTAAMEAWGEASKLNMVSSAQMVTNEAAGRWNEAMRKNLNNPKLIDSIKDTLKGDELASALFGSTDRAGELGVTRADITIDLARFIKIKNVSLNTSYTERAKLNDGGALGLSEIAAEHFQTTADSIRKNTGLSFSEQNERIAHELVDLSIRLHPRRGMLGGDIDELILNRNGITWIDRKKGCKEQE